MGLWRKRRIIKSGILDETVTEGGKGDRREEKKQKRNKLCVHLLLPYAREFVGVIAIDGRTVVTEQEVLRGIPEVTSLLVEKSAPYVNNVTIKAGASILLRQK